MLNPHTTPKKFFSKEMQEIIEEIEKIEQENKKIKNRIMNYLNRIKNYFGLDFPILGWRWRLHFKQRRKWGFDDSETWSLCDNITNYILPRLKRFREVHCDHPVNMSFKKWDKILEQMIFSFEYIKKDEGYKDINREENYKKVNQGLKLFSKYFWDLWW